MQLSLIRRIPGPEATFVLAGFLKILTMAGLSQSAPEGAMRTAFGETLHGTLSTAHGHAAVLAVGSSV